VTPPSARPRRPLHRRRRHPEGPARNHRQRRSTRRRRGRLGHRRPEPGGRSDPAAPERLRQPVRDCVEAGPVRSGAV